MIEESSPHILEVSIPKDSIQKSDSKDASVVTSETNTQSKSQPPSPSHPQSKSQYLSQSLSPSHSQSQSQSLSQPQSQPKSPSQSFSQSHLPSHSFQDESSKLSDRSSSMVDSIDDRKFQRKSKKKLKGEDAKALKRLSMDESVPIYVNISEIEVKKVIKVSRWVENKLWIRANCGKDQWIEREVDTNTSNRGKWTDLFWSFEVPKDEKMLKDLVICLCSREVILGSFIIEKSEWKKLKSNNNDHSEDDDTETKSAIKSIVTESDGMRSFAIKGLLVNSLGKVCSILVKGSIGTQRNTPPVHHNNNIVDEAEGKIKEASQPQEGPFHPLPEPTISTQPANVSEPTSAKENSNNNPPLKTNPTIEANNNTPPVNDVLPISSTTPAIMDVPVALNPVTQPAQPAQPVPTLASNLEDDDFHTNNFQMASIDGSIHDVRLNEDQVNPLNPDAAWLINNNPLSNMNSIFSEYHEEDVGIKVGGIIIHTINLKNLKKIHNFEANSPIVVISSGKFISSSSEKTNAGSECEWPSISLQVPISSRDLSVTFTVESNTKKIGTINLTGLDLASGKPVENGIYAIEKEIQNGTEPTGTIEIIFQLIAPPPPRTSRTNANSIAKNDDNIPSFWIINEVSLVDFNPNEAEVDKSLFKSLFGTSTEISASCILGTWQGELPTYILDYKSRSAKWRSLNWKVPIPSPNYSSNPVPVPNTRPSTSNSVILGSILENEEASEISGFTTDRKKRRRKAITSIPEEDQSHDNLTSGNSLYSINPNLVYPLTYFRFMLFNSLNSNLGSASISLTQIATQKIDQYGQVELYANLMNEKGSMIGKIRFNGSMEYGGVFASVMNQNTVTMDNLDSVTIASSHNNDEFVNHMSQAHSISPSLEYHYLSLTFPLTMVINSSLIFGLSKQFSSLSSWISRINTKNYPIFHPSHNSSAKYNQGDGYFLHIELHIDRQIFSSPIPMEYNKSMVKWNNLNWRAKVNPDSVIRFVLSVYTLDGLNETLERENVFNSKNTRRKLFNKDSRLSPTKFRSSAPVSSIKTIGTGFKHTITSSSCKEIGRANISPALLIKLIHNFNKFHNYFSPLNEFSQTSSYYQENSFNPATDIPTLTLPLFIREGKGNRVYSGKVVAKAVISICLMPYDQETEDKFEMHNEFERTNEGIQTLIHKPKKNGLTHTINLLTKNNQFLKNKKKYENMKNNIKIWNSYYSDNMDDMSSNYTSVINDYNQHFNQTEFMNQSHMLNNQSHMLNNQSHILNNQSAMIAGQSHVFEGNQLENDFDENDKNIDNGNKSFLLHDANEVHNSTVSPSPLEVLEASALAHNYDLDDDSTVMTGNLTEKKLKLRKSHLKYYDKLEATNGHLKSNLNQDHDNYYFNYQNYNYMLNNNTSSVQAFPAPAPSPAPASLILSPHNNTNQSFYNSSNYITFNPQLLPNFNPFEAINMGHQIILKIHDIDVWDLFSFNSVNPSPSSVDLNSPCVSLVYGKNSFMTEIVKNGDECCYWKDLNISLRISNFSSRLRVSVNSIDFNNPTSDELNYYTQNILGVVSLPIEAFLIPCLELTNPNYLRQIMSSEYGQDNDFKVPFSGGWYDPMEDLFKLSINLGDNDGENLLEDDEIIIPPATDEVVDEISSKKIKSSQSFHTLPSAQEDPSPSNANNYYLNNNEKEDENALFKFMESYDLHYINQNSLHTLPSGLNDILSTQLVSRNSSSVFKNFQQAFDKKIKGKLKFSYSLQYVSNSNSANYNTNSYEQTYQYQNPHQFHDLSPTKTQHSNYELIENDKDLNYFHSPQFQQEMITNAQNERNNLKLPPINPNGRPLSASHFQKQILSTGEIVEPGMHSRPQSGHYHRPNSAEYFDPNMANTFPNDFQYTSENIRSPYESSNPLENQPQTVPFYLSPRRDFNHHDDDLDMILKSVNLPCQISITDIGIFDIIDSSQKSGFFKKKIVEDFTLTVKSNDFDKALKFSHHRSNKLNVSFPNLSYKFNLSTDSVCTITLSKGSTTIGSDILAPETFLQIPMLAGGIRETYIILKHNKVNVGRVMIRFILLPTLIEVPKETDSFIEDDEEEEGEEEEEEEVEEELINPIDFFKDNTILKLQFKSIIIYELPSLHTFFSAKPNVTVSFGKYNYVSDPVPSSNVPLFSIIKNNKKPPLNATSPNLFAKIHYNSSSTISTLSATFKGLKIRWNFSHLHSYITTSMANITKERELKKKQKKRQKKNRDNIPVSPVAPVVPTPASQAGTSTLDSSGPQLRLYFESKGKPIGTAIIPYYYLLVAQSENEKTDFKVIFATIFNANNVEAGHVKLTFKLTENNNLYAIKDKKGDF